jgi:hypothetical protein
MDLGATTSTAHGGTRSSLFAVPGLGQKVANCGRSGEGGIQAGTFARIIGDRRRSVLAGDMNDAPDSASLAPLRDLGLKDALTDPTETRPAPPDPGDPAPASPAWTQLSRAGWFIGVESFLSGPAANNPSPRAVVRRHADNATRQRTRRRTGSTAGPEVFGGAAYAASGMARALASAQDSLARMVGSACLARSATCARPLTPATSGFLGWACWTPRLVRCRRRWREPISEGRPPAGEPTVSP